MHNLEIKSLEEAGRATAVWSSDTIDKPSRLESIVFAILPATVILLVAAVLLVTWL